VPIADGKSTKTLEHLVGEPGWSLRKGRAPVNRPVNRTLPRCRVPDQPSRPVFRLRDGPAAGRASSLGPAPFSHQLPRSRRPPGRKDCPHFRERPKLDVESFSPSRRHAAAPPRYLSAALIRSLICESLVRSSTPANTARTVGFAYSKALFRYEEISASTAGPSPMRPRPSASRGSRCGFLPSSSTR
jgi:hypothetical protein